MTSHGNIDAPFRVWKTIPIGTFKDVEKLKKVILDAGFCIGDWADDVLNSSSFILTTKPTKINLVRISVAKLGFKKGAYRKDIYERALELGLKLCPLEVSPYLRLQYKDQPRLESLQIGMKHQKDRKNHMSEFRIVHGADDFLWLVGDHKHPDDFWNENELFVFIK